MKTMYKYLIVICLLPFVLLGCGKERMDELNVHAEMDDDRIVVNVNEEEFTSYLFGQNHKYPFFYPVNGPVTGKTLTTRNQEPYPHQSSLFFSLDFVQSENVERGNYWQPQSDLETGHAVSLNPRILQNDGQKVIIQDEVNWIVPATGSHQFSDIRTVTITAPTPEIRIMDFELTLKVEKDLAIRPTGHSFFSVRMTPELSVGDMDHGPEQAPLGRGSIRDAYGNINEAETRGMDAPWCAYFGPNNDVIEGLAIIQHSDNPFYPGLWVNRDYGFMSPSSFAFNNEPREFQSGDEMTFRYRVVVFTGDPESVDFDSMQNDFLSSRINDTR